MPKVTEIKNKDELFILEMFNPNAAKTISNALDNGQKVEKIESLFSDGGADFVEFTVDGKNVAYINGY